MYTRLYFTSQVKYSTTDGDIVRFLGIKHVGFWRGIDGDDVFLSETSGFLKIHSQKQILCAIENYFHIFPVEILEKSLQIPMKFYAKSILKVYSTVLFL